MGGGPRRGLFYPQIAPQLLLVCGAICFGVEFDGWV